MSSSQQPSPRLGESPPLLPTTTTSSESPVHGFYTVRQPILPSTIPVGLRVALDNLACSIAAFTQGQEMQEAARLHKRLEAVLLALKDIDSTSIFTQRAAEAAAQRMVHAALLEPHTTAQEAVKVAEWELTYTILRTEAVLENRYADADAGQERNSLASVPLKKWLGGLKEQRREYQRLHRDRVNVLRGTI